MTHAGCRTQSLTYSECSGFGTYLLLLFPPRSPAPCVMVLIGAQGAGRWVTIRRTHEVATVITTGGDGDARGGVWVTVS